RDASIVNDQPCGMSVGAAGTSGGSATVSNPPINTSTASRFSSDTWTLPLTSTSPSRSMLLDASQVTLADPATSSGGSLGVSSAQPPSNNTVNIEIKERRSVIMSSLGRLELDRQHRRHLHVGALLWIRHLHVHHHLEIGLGVGHQPRQVEVGAARALALQLLERDL